MSREREQKGDGITTCPNCQARNFEVEVSGVSPKNGFRIRKYRCFPCRYSWATFEMPHTEIMDAMVNFSKASNTLREFLSYLDK